MPVRSKPAIQSDVDNFIADSPSQNITAAEVRSIYTDIIDTMATGFPLYTMVPSGVNRSIQFNAAGVFAGDSGFVFTADGGLVVPGSGSFNSNVYLNNNAVLILKELTANGANSVQIRAPEFLDASWSLVLPSGDGEPGQLLCTDGNGNTVWATKADGVMAASGNDRSIQFNSNTELAGDSLFLYTAESGLVVPQSGSFGGQITVRSNNGLRLFDGDTNTVTIIAPSNLTSTYNFTLPTTAGNNGQVLQTDGAGNLSWTTVSGGGGGSGSPGGSDRQVQYNNAGTFGADVGFIFTTNSGLAIARSGQFGGHITIQNASGLRFISNGNVLGFLPPTGLLATYNFRLPTGAGGAGHVLTTDGVGNTVWSSTGVTVTPAGSDRQIQFNNAGVFGATTGLRLTTSTGLVVQGSGSFGNDITIYNGSGIQLTDVNDGSIVRLRAAANSDAYTFTLPGSGGTLGHVLRTDGAGGTSWVPVTGAGATPGGSDRQIQFNDGGVFGANTGLRYTSTSGLLVAGSGSFGSHIHLKNQSFLHFYDFTFDNFVRMKAPFAVVSSYNITLPDAAPTGNYQTIVTDNSAQLRWTGFPMGGGTPAGQNREIQFNNAGTFGAYSGLTVTSGGSIIVPSSGEFNGELILRNNNGVRLYEANANGAENILLGVPSSLTSSLSFILPNSAGSAGQVLQTDGAGNTSWSTRVSAASGSDRQIQFNNGGAFGAISGFSITTSTGLIVGGSGSFDRRVTIMNGGGLDLADLDGSMTTVIPHPTSVAWTLRLPANAGSNGQLLQTDGNGNTVWATVSGGGGSGFPGGSDRQIQFNNAGTFGGVAGFSLTSNTGLVVQGTGLFSNGSVTAMLVKSSIAGHFLDSSTHEARLGDAADAAAGYFLDAGGRITQLCNDAYSLQTLGKVYVQALSDEVQLRIDGGGGSSNVVEVRPSGAGVQFSIDRQGSIAATSGSFQGSLTVLNNNGVRLSDSLSNFVVLKVAPTSTAYTFTLPESGGIANQVLRTDGNGTTSWITVSGSSGIPGGSDRQVQFNNNGTFGANAGFNYTSSSGIVVSQSGSFGGGITIYNHLQGLKLADSDGSLTTIIPHPTSTAYTFRLPASGGVANYVLSTDGNGSTTWVAQSGGGTTSPAGLNRSIQFNAGGSFGGYAGFTLTTSTGLQVEGTGQFNYEGETAVLAKGGVAGLFFNSANYEARLGDTADAAAGYFLDPNPGNITQLCNGTYALQTLGKAYIQGLSDEVQLRIDGAGGSSNVLDIRPDGGSITFSVDRLGCVNAISGTFNGDVTILSNKSLRLSDSNDGSYINIKAPSTADSYTLTLPSNDGNAGEVLVTDGNGTTSWAPSGGGGVGGGGASLDSDFSTVVSPSSTIGLIKSYTVSSLSANDFIRATYWGTATAVSSTRNWQLYYGGTQVLSFSSSSSSLASWKIELVIGASGTTKQKVNAIMHTAAGHTINTTTTSLSNGAGDIRLSGSSDGTADWTLQGFALEWY